MPVSIISTPSRMTALLSGEIDHHNAGEIRESIDLAVIKQRPLILRLDFGRVSFMDSSGVGLVMGRYRTVSAYGGRVEIANLSGSIERVMKLSGIERIAKIVKEATI